MSADDLVRHPELYSTWRHHRISNLTVYRVIGITNTRHRSSNHPIMVVYVGSNQRLWSRPLLEWYDKMVPYVQEEW